jgi:hypothetical protein
MLTLPAQRYSGLQTAKDNVRRPSRFGEGDLLADHVLNLWP